jgi:hypothetical protein
MHADITLATVALDKPNNVSAFITDAPYKRAPMVCPLFQNRESLPFPDSFIRTVTEQQQSKLRGLGPQANCADRATAACRRS